MQTRIASCPSLCVLQLSHFSRLVDLFEFYFAFVVALGTAPEEILIVCTQEMIYDWKTFCSFVCMRLWVFGSPFIPTTRESFGIDVFFCKIFNNSTSYRSDDENF